MSIQCRSCSTVIANLPINPGLEGYSLPRKCNTEQAGRPKCPLDPFFIMPDKCKCVDFQIIKLQELPDYVPQVSLIYLNLESFVIQFKTYITLM